MDKQKKFMLQVVIPVAFVILSLIFFVIFKFVFTTTKKEGPVDEINIEFPDVKKSIETDKIKAYANQENYMRQNTESDLQLEYNPPALDSAIKTTEPEQTPPSPASSRKNEATSRKLKKKLIKQAEIADEEYKDFIGKPANEKNPETETPPSLTAIPPKVTFNSFTVTPKTNHSSSEEVAAFIHNEQTVINRSLIKIRTGEPITINRYTIPGNTLLWGMCTFSNNRVLITIRSIPYRNRSIACNISVYDLDGFEGINTPYNTDAYKKSGASTSKKIGSTLSTAARSLAGNTLAGEISSTIAEGVIKGATNGTSNNISMNKVTLPNNYRIILKLN